MNKYSIYFILAFCLHIVPATAWAQDAAVEVESQTEMPVDVQTTVTTTKEVTKVAKKTDDDPDKTEKSEGDTYNFYFQKGSGPGSVEQGAGQQKVDAKSVIPEEARSTPLRPDFPWFEPQVALVFSNGGAGISAGGQFNFSRTLGLQVHLLALEHDGPGEDYSDFSASGTDEVSTDASSKGGDVAIAYTPTTFNATTMPIRVSALLGAMMLSTEIKEKHSEFSASGSRDWTNSTRSTKGVGFIGVQGTAYLGNNWGAYGYGKLASDTDYSQVGIGVSYAL